MINKPEGEMPTTFIRTLKTIRLPHAVLTRMRDELIAYTDLHTVSENRSISQTSPFAILFKSRALYASALALVVIVATGTQASFAAEKAVPGDILYPIKVAVAEPIALALSGSEGKAELSARFASRRVEEAVQLSSAGKLDEAIATELSERFDAHVDTLAKETAVLEADGELAFSLALRSDLEQKLATRAEAISPREEVVLAKRAVEAPVHNPGERFAARIVEKSKMLATTREHLESVLAIDTPSDETPVNLAALRTEASSEGIASARLFSATLEEPEATSTATSTATTTPEGTEQKVRFFAPFMKR